MSLSSSFCILCLILTDRCSRPNSCQSRMKKLCFRLTYWLIWATWIWACLLALKIIFASTNCIIWITMFLWPAFLRFHSCNSACFRGTLILSRQIWLPPWSQRLYLMIRCTSLCHFRGRWAARGERCSLLLRRYTERLLNWIECRCWLW